MEYVNPKELKEYPYSRKLFPKLEGEAYELLKEDIKKRGITNPIVATKDKVILCGHERTRVALELGMMEVPINYFGGTDTEAQIFLIVENIARKDVDFGTRYICSNELKRLYGLKQGQTKTEVLIGRATEEKIMTNKEIDKIAKISRKTRERANKIDTSTLPLILKQKALVEGESIETISNLVGKSKNIVNRIAEKVKQGVRVPTAVKEVLDINSVRQITCPIPKHLTEEELSNIETAKMTDMYIICPHCKKKFTFKEAKFE